MERDSFVFKTQISFAIKSDTIEPDIITKELGITPSDSSFKKGDSWMGKNTKKIYIRNSNIWRIETKWTVLEEETVSHHIEYLKTILMPKSNILKLYKEDDKYELSFWIWIETDDAGVGLDLKEEELSFLNLISNYIHFTVIGNTSNVLCE